MCKIANKVEMNQVMMTIEDLDAQIKALQEQREEAVSHVKKFMKDRDNVLTENFNVNYTKFTQSRFDTNSFKEDHKDIYDLYIKETSSTRFTYKRRIDESTA